MTLTKALTKGRNRPYILFGAIITLLLVSLMARSGSTEVEGRESEPAFIRSSEAATPPTAESPPDATDGQITEL
ncbi:hypothetical protein KKF84_05885 [Myxococcota bacterium]|nr:hypothetical protein [Myxococcota bacterium]